MLRAERVSDQPIISADMDARMGANINGPSLIRVPDWVERPLGRYYLYFADHKGDYIRLAYADAVIGPWHVHTPGALQLAESCFTLEPPSPPPESPLHRLRAEGLLGESPFTPHIASPDVHVIPESRQIRMYYHGLLPDCSQKTRVAISRDGLHFEACEEVLGLPYFRVFRLDGWFYALAMPGLVYRSRDGLTGFERGPRLFDDHMRHSAVRVAGGVLQVWFTQVGHAPERILYSEVPLHSDWMTWRQTEPVEVLRPELPWEGADILPVPSVRGESTERLCELRDPAVFEDGDELWLVYAGAGENGLGLARLRE